MIGSILKSTTSGLVFKSCRALRFQSQMKRTDLALIHANVGQLARSFATSSPRQALPAFVLVLLKPISKLGVMLVGRGFRKWWSALPKAKKEIAYAHFKRNGLRYGAGLSLTTAMTFAFYESHIELTPITKRKRFMLFTTAQLKEFEDIQKELLFEEHKKDILPPNAPETQRAVRIARRLFDANREIAGVNKINWRLTVIDSDLLNAAALPNGDVIVYTGLLDFVQNDDELATILAHEMSHAILEHTAEEFSHGSLIDIASIGISLILWAFLPSDLTALVSNYVANKLLQYTFTMPYSRLMEKEADTVGLTLAAKACFDVRYSPGLWTRMKEFETHSGQEIPEFFSTHPSSESRANDLKLQIPDVS